MKQYRIKDRSELKKIIRSRIEEGMSRRDVYESLKGSYRSDHAIAVMVGEHPELHLKRRYRPHSILLGLFLLFTAGGLFYLALSGKAPADGETLFNAALVPLLMIPVSVWVFQFIPFAMRVSYYLGYGSLLLDLYFVSRSAPVGQVSMGMGIAGWSVVLLSAAIIAVSSYLKRKLMPGYGLMGPGQDSSGNYRFSADPS